MGHGQLFTVVYTEEGIGRIIPGDPIGCIRPAAMFYVVPVATIVKTIIGTLMPCRAFPSSKSTWGAVYSHV
eukprot:2942203-Pleurochrysis_carterae.AAC.1